MFRHVVSRGLHASCGLRYASPSTPSAKLSCDSPKIAVVLSGCGYLDGSEVHETVAVLGHLTRNGAVPHCFAPNMEQCHVINHCSQTVDENDTRNVMVESSRVARHPVKPLCKLVEDSECYKGVIFPGGFGVAKNLSNFATKGIEMEVIPDVEYVLKRFCEMRKPIGVLCIAPILIAKVFPCTIITLGKDAKDKWPYRDVIPQARQMGAIVEEKDWYEVSVDRKRKVLSTPAYMYDGEYHEIYESCGNLVRYMLAMITRPDPEDLI